jgi:hypothetical protein
MDSAPGSPRASRVAIGLEGIALALLALYLAVFFAGNVSLQWDLRVYLTAAETALAGGDPYDTAQLTRTAGRPMLPFVYPPVALLPFLALAALPNAAALWLGFKLALLAGLAILWRGVFVPRTPVLIVALVAVFGWNGAALWDLRAGNVATLETALLWAAFACFVRGRRAAFAVLVGAAACFKLLPAAFLLLLLVPAGAARPAPRGFLVAGLALAATIALPLVAGPSAAWSGFLRNVPPAMVAGEANPGAWSFFAALLGAGGADAASVLRGSAIGYAVYALALVALAAPHLGRLARARDARGWVVAAVFLYVLLAPRPMAYGYMLLGVAPFMAPPRPFDGPIGRWLLAALLCVQGVLRVAHFPPSGLVATYAPLLFTLAIWLLVLKQSAAAAPSSRRAA